MTATLICVQKRVVWLLLVEEMATKRRCPKGFGFAKAGTFVFSLDRVVWADFGDIEELKVCVELEGGKRVDVEDIDAIELAMLLKPSVMESKRLRWVKFAWMVHNVVGHPVMQVLALFGAYRWAFWVHDVTVPRPVGKRKKKTE